MLAINVDARTSNLYRIKQIIDFPTKLIKLIDLFLSRKSHLVLVQNYWNYLK